MKNFLSFESQLSTYQPKTPSIKTPASVDIYPILYNLYFNIRQEPLSICSLPSTPKKINYLDPLDPSCSSCSSIISIYNQDLSLSIQEEQEAILSFKSLNQNLCIIKKTQIQTEQNIFDLFLSGYDSFYIYPSYLDDALVQYFIEIAREFKTEAIVLVSNMDELHKALKTDAKIVGVTQKNYLNQKLDQLLTPIQTLFETLLDQKPELVLIYDI